MWSYWRLSSNSDWREVLLVGHMCGCRTAPCYTSRKWLENFYDFTSPNLWPPNSHDCNPSDYCAWDAVEVTSRSTGDTKVRIEAKIKELYEHHPRSKLRNACTRFWNRFEASEKAEGRYIDLTFISQP